MVQVFNPLPTRGMASSGSVTLAELAVLPSLTIQSWMPTDLVVRVMQPNYYYNGTISTGNGSSGIPGWVNRFHTTTAAPFTDQRVDMAGVGTAPTSPTTVTISVAPQLYKLNNEGNPYSVNVLTRPSLPSPAVAPHVAPYMTLEYEGAFYQYTSTNGPLYTFTKSALSGTGSAPPLIYGVMLPSTGSIPPTAPGTLPPTGTPVPFTPAILQFVPQQLNPATLVLQNNTPYVLTVSPPGGSVVSVPSGGQTNLAGLPLASVQVAATQVPLPPVPPGGSRSPPAPTTPTVVTGFTSTAALVTAGVACSLTFEPIWPTGGRVPEGTAFDVRMTANGTTGVVTAEVFWQGSSGGVLFNVSNSTPVPVTLTAAYPVPSGPAAVGAFQVISSDTDPSLVTGTYTLSLVLQPFTVLGICMTDAWQPGPSYLQNYLITANANGAAAQAVTMPPLGTTFPQAAAATGAASSTSPWTTSGSSISSFCGNWWPGTPAAVPYQFVDYLMAASVFKIANPVLPTLRQAMAQWSLLLTTTPLIVLQASGSVPLSLQGSITPSVPVPGFPPELVVPVPNTYLPGGGAANAPASAPQPGSPPQPITTAAPLPLLNVDGGFVVKIVSGTNGAPLPVFTSPLDGGVANRWQPDSDYGALTFFLPAFVQKATAPAIPFSTDNNGAVNVYTAQAAGTSGATQVVFISLGAASIVLPVWVTVTTAWRVVLNVSYAVPADSVGNGEQYLQNVCGGNGFTDCRPISGRPQTSCLGYFDNTVGPLCQAIVLDSASGPDTDYVAAFNAININYCGGPGSPGPGWSTDACACLAVNGSGKLASPTRWALPGAGESSISFPDYVAKYNAQGFGTMPALMTNPVYAPCWWPPCTGATPALVPLASTRGGSAACTGTVTNCFGAVNSVITDKTSKTTEVVNNACSPPATPGGNAGGGGGKGVGLGGTRARAVTPNTIGDPPTTWKTPGAIAGIVIGCVVVVIAVALVVYYNKRGFVKK